MTARWASPSTLARRIRLSIAGVLTIGLGGLMLTALGAVALVTLGVSERNTTDLLRKFSEVTLGSINLQVDRYIQSVRGQATYIARQIAEDRLDLSDRRSLSDLMAGSLAGVPQSRGLAVFTPDGRALRVGRVRGELVVSSDSWRNEAGIPEIMNRLQAGQSTDLRTVIWVPQLRETTIAVNAPIEDDGAFAGVVTSVVGLTALSGFLRELSHEYDGTAFILYGRDLVLAHPSLAGGMRGVSSTQPLPALADVQDPVLARIWDEPDDTLDRLLAGTELSGHVLDVNGRTIVFVYQEIEGVSAEPWIIGAYLDGAAVVAPVRRLIDSALVALAIVVVSLLAAILLGRAIARPITRLATAAAAIERLDFDRVPPASGSFFREIDVADQSFRAMLGGLRLFGTYVPKRLVERLVALGGIATRSETREVTVLFTDIVGFTGFAESLEAEKAATFLNSHFELLGSCIEAEEGTIDKYIGDSVMAFWGAPLDQVDHAERACRAALAIAAAVEADNEQRDAVGARTVALRIGIHSGPAIVGNIGAPGRVNYTLVGDTVNTAQRLEGLGREYVATGAVQILISADTHSRLPDTFHCTALGSVQLRGQSRDTTVFRLDDELDAAQDAGAPSSGSVQVIPQAKDRPAPSSAT